MSNQDYYAEEALKTIKNRMHRDQVMISALKSIERKKTKDGKDFKELSKNFTQGAIKPNPYCPREKELHYYVYDAEIGHVSDTLNISPTVYSDSEDAKKYAAEGRLQERGFGLHPFVTMTPDEIEQAIQNRIEYYQGMIDQYQLAIDQFDDIIARIHDIQKQYDGLLSDVPGATHYIFRNVLFRQSER